MTRLTLLIAFTIALLSTPGPQPYFCTSDSDCAAYGIVTCPLCPDYTEHLR